MSLLIRRGMLMTMGAIGCLTGDVLIREGRIVQVAPLIDTEEECQELDAGGLTIIPGMIDAHLHGEHEEHAVLSRMMLDGGITGGLVWPEEGMCRMVQGYDIRDSGIMPLLIRGHSARQLTDRIRSMKCLGLQPICEVSSEDEGRRILKASADAECPVILVHLSGCEALTDEIAASGCDAVIGVRRQWGNSPWRFAARLDAMGVRVAVTCDHPSAMLRHLPVCAALCMRDGMEMQRALQTVTRRPAEILGLADAGQIAPGFRADLAMYDGDPLLLASSHVMTICCGKVHRSVK